MIRLRNLDKGSGKFNGALIRGTSANPFDSSENPLLDLRELYSALTTGWTGIRMAMAQGTTAQASGTNYVARFRGENRVDTSIGTIVAGDFIVKNYNDAASLALLALSVEVDANGKNALSARAAEFISGNGPGVGTVSTLLGLRVRVVGAGTVTNGPWGLQIVDDSPSASAAQLPLKAFIRLEYSSAVDSYCAIDATAASLRGAALYSVTLTAKDNVLFYYKDFDGTAHAVVASDGDALAVRT